MPSVVILRLMKTKITGKLAAAMFVVLAVLGAACGTTPAAKISRADAERVALARVPTGVVKEGELENEHGRLIWTFDIATPGKRGITEIHVDAFRCEVIATENESDEQEKSEKRREK